MNYLNQHQHIILVLPSIANQNHNWFATLAALQATCCRVARTTINLDRDCISINFNGGAPWQL